MLVFCLLVGFLGITTSAPPRVFKFLDNSKLNSLTVRLGFPIIIDCETTDGTAKVSLWKTNDRGKKGQVIQSLDVIQSGEIFTIPNPDLDDLGYYECQATNAAGRKIVKRVVVVLNYNKPSLALKPSKLHVAEKGSNVTFTCEAVKGVISWTYSATYNQQLIKPSKYSVKKGPSNSSITLSILTIPNAQVSNSGIYSCWLYVNHHVSDFTQSKYVDLLVKDPQAPTFSNHQNLQKAVKLGEKIILPCAANGFPKPTIFWEKNGKRFSPCTIGFVHSCSGSPYTTIKQGHVFPYSSPSFPLTLQSARFPSDNGTFTCVAKSSSGTAKKHYEVVVEVKPKLDKGSQLILENIRSPPSRIKCSATEGNPAPTFTWSMQFSFTNPKHAKPNQYAWGPLRKQVTAEASKDGMSSTVEVPRSITSAFFKCVAKNSAGEDSHVFQLFRYFTKL